MDQPTPPSFDEPPAHLVRPPRPARRRPPLHAGTPLFNGLAVVALAAVSSFVLLSPTGPTAPGAAGDGGGPVVLEAEEAVDGSTPAPRPAPAPSPVTPVPDLVPVVASQPAPVGTTTTAARVAAPAAARPAAAVVARLPRCEDYTTQPAAQGAFDADPAGLAGLDGDGDGLACEHLPGAPKPGQPVAPPAPPRCEDFTTQPAAQDVFDTDPAGLAAMDADGDGVACEHLPGAPPEVPTTAALVRPTTRYFGVHTRQAPFWMPELDSFAAAAGKTPNMVLLFQTLDDPYPSAAVKASWRRGILPMISLEPIRPSAEGRQPRLSDFFDGSLDAWIDGWAGAVKAQGLPVALRFAHEMNGDWYTWSEGVNGNKPGDYVRAWRYIHDRFEDLGVENVIWVWSVNRIDTLKVRTISQFYPGADYVDWVGMSGYLRQVSEGQTPSFAATFAATLGALRTVAPGKPVVLTEVGAGTGEGTRVTWIESFFAGLLEHPEVLGFVWMNDHKSGGDWRIEYSARTTAAFAAGVADPRYGSGVPAV